MPKLRYPIPRMTPVHKLSELALDGADGRGWYEFASYEISRAAVRLDCTPELLAEMLALFSPRVSVTRSIKWAVHYIKTKEFMADCPRSVRQAVDHWLVTGKIRGLKTGPFARALLGDKSAVVIDTWVAKALGIDAKRLEVKAVWSRAAEQIRRTAEYLGWPVAETQAAIWVAIVRKDRATVPQMNIMAQIDPEIPV